jgi:multicomponent K+:H+ antiporter subunit F
LLAKKVSNEQRTTSNELRMEHLLDWTLRVSLLIHLAIIAVCVWRVWRGENVIDRLLAADLTGILMLAVLVLLALLRNDSFFIDIGLVLAALGFISTVMLARYVVDERVF